MAAKTFLAGNLTQQHVARPRRRRHHRLHLDTVTNGLTAGGGTFNIFADGSFNYISQAGDRTDTFTYTIRDAGIDGVAGNADDTTSTATVTITSQPARSGMWTAPPAPAATGTSTNPFSI